MSPLNHLRRNPLFQGLPESALHEAAKVVTERQFQPGETVLSQDTQGEALFLLTGGTVRVSRVSLGGHERVMGDLYAPAVIGETAVLDGGERSATVLALTEVRTLMLYRTHFQQLLGRHPELLWNLSRLLVQRITALNDELIAFGLNTETALSHVLLQHYRQRARAGVAEPQHLPLATADIMQRISSSRETVARVMRKLQKQGLVVPERGGLTLPDPGALELLTLHHPEE